jgi:hypothetical protein
VDIRAFRLLGWGILRCEFGRSVNILSLGEVVDSILTRVFWGP